MARPTASMIVRTAKQELSNFNEKLTFASTYQRYCNLELEGPYSNWCCAFVTYVFYHTEGRKEIYFPGKITGTVQLRDWFIEKGVGHHIPIDKDTKRPLNLDYEPKPGDIVFFRHEWNDRPVNHVGIVSKAFTPMRGIFKSFEGNVGGKVAEVEHRTDRDWPVFYARPNYREGIPPVGQSMPDFPLPSGWVFAKGGYQSYNGITDSWGPYIEYIQEALNLVADGRFGEATHQAVLAFQAQRGLSQDGKVGRNTWNALREKRDGGSSSGGSSSSYDDGSIYTGAFKLPSGHCYTKLAIAYASHNGHENASDRPAIRGIQRKLGLSADGLFGNGTHNAVVSFQTKYGLTADGKVGPSTWRSIIFNTDGGSVYGGNSFLLPRGHCYGKLGIKYASHNGYENSSDRPAIRKIQQRLGLYSDGLFGSDTHSAVVAFQRSRGLTADGKVGPGTWNKMF